MENKIIINELNIGKRLDQFMQEKFPEFSRAHIQNAISKGEIKLVRNKKILENNAKNKEKSLKNGEKLKNNDIISYFFEKPKEINLKPENMFLDIIYEDSDLAVINKPQ